MVPDLVPGEAEFLEAARQVLPRRTAELLRGLHDFTRERLEAAALCRTRIRTAHEAGDPVGVELHAFLRESWGVLDGLAREVSACMAHLAPEAGPGPPGGMWRRCTFYVLRRTLHAHPSTADHPVSRLLWEHTRTAPALPYRRLSFLYNLSLFLPLWPLPEPGRLPGRDDVPEAARGSIRDAGLPPCGLREGTREIRDWLEGLLGECYARLTDALRTATR
ncbi:MAG: hypothetical protein GXY85_06245 [Candidatus Brocadiaceae bacterium]|nr:hypothetical protein [Candidatus Brocadiaceae bacterium]